VRAAATVGAPLLAPDPGVPGRDALLDAEEMTDRLSRLLGRDGPAGIDRYARGRVKYKVGESLRVVHEIEVDGAPWIVASRTFPNGRSERVYERAFAEATDADPLLGVAHDPELHAVFWTFPNDRKLATLPALLPATDTVSDLLGRPIARTILAAYAPEKSATAACFDELLGRPVAYAKVFADLDELRASHRAHTAVFDRLGTGHSALRVPAVLASSEDDRMLVVEAIQGRRIDTMRGPELAEAMRRFGAALAAFHSLPAPSGLPRFTRLDPERQAPAAELIGRARPDVAVAAARLAGELAGAAPAGAETVLVHGDVHPKNALLQGRRIALIDLDQTALGTPAMDLGSALAGLRYRALVDDGGARAERVRHALLDGYTSARELPDAADLDWHVAAALLSERALRAVNRVREDGLLHLGAVLADARAVLRGESHR
jgi:aminoglycoside phosphotransferase (APT) family kinase protein